MLSEETIPNLEKCTGISARISAARCEVAPPSFRPVRRVISTYIEGTESLGVSLNTGALRIKGIEGSRLTVHAAVRSRLPEIADDIRPVIRADEEGTQIAFEGTALKNPTTSVTIDLTIGLPAGIPCAARVSLGNICAERVHSAVDLYAGLGQIQASLSERWSGDDLRITPEWAALHWQCPKHYGCA